MRSVLVFVLMLIATPALAQFPPPGLYACAADDDVVVGMLTLLVAGDYRWSAADGSGGEGQISSAGNTVEAISGPLDLQHWVGRFADEAGNVTYAFETDTGPVTCALPG